MDEGECDCDDEAAEIYIFTAALLRVMDEAYMFTASRNAEVLLRWHSLAIQSQCDWVVPSVIDFVTSQGRMKYVRPLYRALLRSPWRRLAMNTFEENQDR